MKETFIQKLASHILSHYNLTNQELTIVFPNKRAALYLRSEFQKTHNDTIWLPQMLSIEEAMTQWSGLTLVDNIDMLFELIDIDAQFPNNQDHNTDLSVFGSQAAQMAKDFDEIDQYQVDAFHTFNFVKENKQLEFWNFDEEKSKEKELKYLQFFSSLYEYYARLRERLLEKQQGYYGLITRTLSELPEEELLQRIGEKKVIFAGFNALTTTEQFIIETLMKNGKAEIFFDYDRYYVDDENNEAGHFARLYRNTHPEWLKDGISGRLQTEEKNIHIISAGGNTLQTKSLQAKLQETDHAKQAVILADEHLLIPVLNAIPDSPIYTDFKVSMGYPIGKTPVNQLIKEYFALHRRNRISRTITEKGTERIAEGWYIWPVLRLMDLEIVKIIFPKEEIAAFSQWKTQAVNEGKFIFERKDLDSLSQTPKIQQFIRLVLSDKSENESTLDKLSQILKFVADQILGQKTENNSMFLLNQVGEIGKIVNRLAHIIEHNKNYINDLQSIETLYRLLSANATLKLKSSNTEGLQIMGLLETRNIDLERLHILSVNEGILPADKSQGSFIPYFIRHQCGLPGYREKQAVYAYHFYRLLQNGTDIYLYYNNLDETSGGEASRFILQVKHELARNPNIKVTEESFSSSTQSSAEATAISAQKAAYAEQIKQFAKEHGFAPTSLSTYINCPLKFYLKYIIGIEDNSVEEEVGYNVIGTVIHDTLEFLFKDYLPKDGKQQVIDKELFDKTIAPQWEQKLAQAIEKNLPDGFPDVGFNYLNKVTIRQQLKNYLKYTSKQLENNTLTVLETEGELKTKLSTTHGDCVFYGRTDRIDQFDGLIRVIDYKTGKVENNDLKLPVRQPDDSDLDYLRQIPEKALQLLLYKYLYLRNHPETPASKVTGAIHGLKYANNIGFELIKANKKGEDNAFLEGDNFIHDMEAMLQAIVGEMFDMEAPFMQAEDDKKCRYCDFKLICKR